jgi:hypothetical protein
LGQNNNAILELVVWRRTNKGKDAAVDKIPSLSPVIQLLVVLLRLEEALVQRRLLLLKGNDAVVVDKAPNLSPAIPLVVLRPEALQPRRLLVRTSGG